MKNVAVRAASTVVLLRDGESELEVLMLRRNKALVFAGGFWVFPGGAVDQADREGAKDADHAARVAAAREAEEEAGVCPEPQDMVLISHWTTPVGEPRRFSTWIYAGEVAADAQVAIDGGEIHDHQWIGVRAALGKHARGELPMLPPTCITLKTLSVYAGASAALAGERESPCPRVLPLMIPIEGEGGFTTLYPGDAGYESGEADADGPRHRSYLKGGCWQYQYEGVTDNPPLCPLD